MSIEDSRISAVENENASHELISDIQQDARLQTSAREGVEAAQAQSTQPSDQQGAQSTETTGRLPAAQEAAAAAPAGQVVPDQNNIAHLPAGTAIDDIHVRGNDLVLVQADGTEIVIVNGALHVPTFLLGEVELPQQAVIAALEQSNINVAAGPDGSYSASSSPSSSGANFQDTIAGNAGDPTQLASLLADTQQADVSPAGARDLNNDTPTALDNAVVLLDDSALPGGNGEATLLNTTGTLGFLSGNDGIGSVLLTGAGLATAPAGEGSFFQTVGADGRSIVISQVQHGTNVTVLTVTLSDTTSGIYTIVQNAAIQHAPGQGENTQAFTIGYEVKDQDGDAANGTLTLNVKDDVIAWSPSEDSNTTVDEHNLGHSTDLPLLRESISSASTTATGDLHISWGADNYDVEGANDGVGRSLVFANAETAVTSALPLTSNGVALTYALSEDGTTLIATAGKETIFTVSLNDDGTGSYTFNLQGPLDHPTAGQDSLGIAFHVVATDSDGDPANIDFTVSVTDDVPTAQGQIRTHYVEEEELKGGNEDDRPGRGSPDADGFYPGRGHLNPTTNETSGSLHISWGSDNGNAFIDGGVGGLGDRSVVFDTVAGSKSLTTEEASALFTVKSGETLLDLGSLKSGGETLTYSLSKNGTVLTASVGEKTIFTVTLTDTGAGGYDFVLKGVLDHPVTASGARNEDVLSLTFNATVRDADGDKITTNFTIGVIDDSPIVSKNDAVQLDDGALKDGDGAPSIAHTTGTLGHAYGADGVGSLILTTAGLNALTSGEGSFFQTISDGGKTLVISQIQHGQQVDVLSVALKDTTSGDYTVTQLAPVQHPAGNGQADLAFTIQYRVTDGDGDVADGKLTVKVKDDVISWTSSDGVSVNEDDLRGGNDPKPEPTKASGDLHISWGADNFDKGGANDGVGRSLVFKTTGSESHAAVVSAVDSLGHAIALTSEGRALTYELSEDGTKLVATAHGDTIFTVTLNDDGSGSYTFHLQGSLDQNVQGEDALALTFHTVATDSDGDPKNVDFTVSVTDDVPFALGQILTHYVEEEELKGGNEDDLPGGIAPDADGYYPFLGHLNPTTNTTSGSLLISWGSDNGNSVVNGGVGGLGDRSVVFATVTGSASVDIKTADAAALISVKSGDKTIALGDLTSGGHALTYTLSNHGTVLTAHVGKDIIFTVSLSDTGAGGYDFVLKGVLDHPVKASGAANEDVLSLTFNATVRDADGDKITTNFTIGVIDDSPIVSSNNTVNLDDDALPGGNPNGNGDGPNAEHVKGTLSHAYGADGAGSLLLTGAGLPATASAEGDFSQSLTPNGKALVISQMQNGVPVAVLTVTLDDKTSGDYSVVQNHAILHAVGHNENNLSFDITYQVKDRDGDTVDGKLTINVDDDTPTIASPATSEASEVGSSQILANGTFEHDSLATGQNGVIESGLGNFSYNAPNGWTITGGAGGLFAPAASIVSAEGHAGGNVVWLRSGATLAKDTGTTLTAGQVYSLHFDVGNRTDQNFGGGVARLIATNGTVTKTLSEIILTEPADGKWGSVDLNSPVISSDYAGWQLRVEITQTSKTGDQILIDDVELRQFTPSIATGSLGINWGADNDVALRGVTFDSQQPSGLTSNGDAIHYTLSTDHTLLTAIAADGRKIFTVELSKTTGEYKLTLLDTLDHQSIPKNGLQFAFTATDADGDPASGKFAVAVADDKPVVSNSDGISQAVVDESGIIAAAGQPAGTDAGHGNVATGTLAVNFGADGFGSTAFTGGFTVAGGASGSLQAGGPGVESGLTSDKRAIFFSLSSDAHTIEGRTESGEVVLRAVLDQGDAGWKVTLLGNIDHQPGDAGRGADRALSFTVIATDGDGDSVDLTLSTTIHDDKPVIHGGSGEETPVFTATAVEDSSGITFNLHDGNKFSFGADGPGAVSFETEHVTITTPAGMTVSPEQLTYTYVQETGIFTIVPGSAFNALGKGDVATINVPFTVTDADGDTKSAVYQVTITGANDDPIANNDVFAAVPNGWTLDAVSGHVYTFKPTDNNETWDNARVKAAELLADNKSYLATITSGDEQAVVLGVVNHDGNQQDIIAYLGGTDEGHEGDWVWATGPEAGQPFTYKNWDADEPNNSNGNENILWLYGQFRGGVWNDAPSGGLTFGGYQFGFVAEAGEPGSYYAAINEDHSYKIDASLLLANDKTVDIGETLSVVGFDQAGADKATSAMGATVRFDGKTFSYDASGSTQLQHLAEGEKATDSFTYTISDGQGGFSTATVTVTVEGRNDKPVFDIAGDAAAVVTEDTKLTETGTINFTDVDLTDTHTVSVTAPQGTTLGSFTLGNVNESALTAGGSVGWTYTLDASARELKAGDVRTETYTVTVSDGHGGVISKDVTITINGTNDAPTAIALSANAVNENQLGATIGHLTTTDKDVGDTHTYTVSDDRFEVVNGDLKLKSNISLNYEAAHSVTVTVTSKDSGNLTTSEDFTINVGDVNEAPTAVTFGGVVSSIDENTNVGAGIKVAVLGATDDALGQNGFSLTGADANSFQIRNGNELYYVGSSPDFETKSSYSVGVNVNDPTVGGDVDASKLFTLNVNDLPEAPLAGLQAGPQYAFTDGRSGQYPAGEPTSIRLDLASLFSGVTAATTYSYEVVRQGNGTPNSGWDNWLTRTGNVLSGDPETNRDGLYVLKVTATNAGVSTSTYVAITAIEDGGTKYTSDAWFNGDGDLYTGVSNVSAGGGDDVIIGSTSAVNTLIGGSGSDQIYGGDKDDTIFGGSVGFFGDVSKDSNFISAGAGNDTIYSGGRDYIFAGSGDDQIYGLDTDKVIDGGDGSDTLKVNLLTYIFDDTQLGDAGIVNIEKIVLANYGTANLSHQTENLTIIGSSGDDIITGGSGDDIIDGSGGKDKLFGGAGDDTFLVNGFTSGETIDGGTGSNRIVLSNSTTANFTTGTISNIQTITGSAGADNITLTAAQWVSLSNIDLGGQSGDKVNIQVNGSFDFSSFTFPTVTGVGAQNLIGGSGNVTVTMTGEQLDAILLGGGVINLGDGSNTLRLTSLSTVLNGLSDARLIGVGTITSLSAAVGVTIDLSNQSEALTIVGSDFADTIRGGANGDTITGGLGDDTLIGNSGNDTFKYQIGDGADTVIGGAGGADKLLITGGNADDLLSVVVFGDNVTQFNGGTVTGVESVSVNLGGGTNTLSYAGTTQNVVVNLDDSAKSATGFSTSSDFSSISNVTGGNGNDTLTGSSSSNVIVGGKGADTITGGQGADTLSGGDGADIFKFSAGDSVISIGNTGGSRTNTGTISGYDVITDFTVANGSSSDKIAFNGMSVATSVGSEKSTLLLHTGAMIAGGTITSGVVQFNDAAGNSKVGLTSIADVAAAVQFLQANDIGKTGSTVVFNALIGTVVHTFVFMQGTDNGSTNSKDVLVDLQCVTATGITIGSGQLAIMGSNAIDPIILDLDHNGIAFTTLEHGVSFDINADGHQDKIAWTAGTDGILAYDVDGNGKIDNGSEIFSPHFAGGNYVDGLQALATLDSNHDGKIDASDEAFSKLLVWQDLNHNGISDAGELSGLADHQIASLSLDAHASESAINGQAILADGSYTLTDGSSGHFVEVAFDATLGSADDHAYSLIGSDGDDLLSGAGGMVTLAGGAGADTFVLDADALSDVKIADVITDYKAGEGDTLDVSKLLDSLLGHQATEAEALSSVKTTVQGADTVVSVNANGGWHDVAVLQNTTEAVKILFDDKHDTTTAPHVG